MTDKELQKKAAQLRVDVLTAICKSGCGFSGGALSVMDILVALYYGDIFGKKVVSVDKFKPDWGSQDFVVMSKISGVISQYAVLADLGFFDKEELNFYGRPNSLLKIAGCRKVPGIALPGANSGESLSMAQGIALSLRMDRKLNKVYAILGDYELQEGQVWEALMSAAYYKLNNLIVFIDNNKMQISGNIKGVMDIDPIQDKFEAFGWQVIKVVDGHDFDKILDAIQRAHTSNRKPVCIWCNTVSGKGVSFIENKPYYHHAVLSEAEMNEAVSNL